MRGEAGKGWKGIRSFVVFDSFLIIWIRFWSLAKEAWLEFRFPSCLLFFCWNLCKNQREKAAVPFVSSAFMAAPNVEYVAPAGGEYVLDEWFIYFMLEYLSYAVWWVLMYCRGYNTSTFEVSSNAVDRDAVTHVNFGVYKRNDANKFQVWFHDIHDMIWMRVKKISRTEWQYSFIPNVIV